MSKNFNIVIERKGYNFYIAYCPQLKGCIAEGTTIEGVLLMFSEALNVYMKSVIKHKDKI